MLFSNFFKRFLNYIDINKLEIFNLPAILSIMLPPTKKQIGLELGFLTRNDMNLQSSTQNNYLIAAYVRSAVFAADIFPKLNNLKF